MRGKAWAYGRNASRLKCTDLRVHQTGDRQPSYRVEIRDRSSIQPDVSLAEGCFSHPRLCSHFKSHERRGYFRDQTPMKHFPSDNCNLWIPFSAFVRIERVLSSSVCTSGRNATLPATRILQTRPLTTAGK